MILQAPISMAARACSIIVDTFVEADRRFELALERGMGVDVVVAERLLDHDQEELVELFSSAASARRVGGIGVDHQANARKSFAQRACRFDVVNPA